MKYNPNKTVSAGSQSMIVSYTDACKHQLLYYDRGLKDLQVQGSKLRGKPFQRIGTSEAELRQQKQYRLALYGIAACTPEEVAQLTFLEKKQIISTQQKVQSVLDKLKQKVAHLTLKMVLNQVFINSSLVQDLANYEDYLDEEQKNIMSFRELGISKDMIIDTLIENNLLPLNFRQV
jgi:hypothetical protein